MEKLNNFSGFSDSFDDSFQRWNRSASPEANSTTNDVLNVEGENGEDDGDDDVLESSDGGRDAGNDETESDSVVFQKRVKDVFEKNSGGRGFVNDILPKLPKLANGMRLLGINEMSPLIDCKEVFKLRVFQPDQPYETSEILEDDCTLRLTNLARLMTDENQLAKYKLEIAVIKPGTVDEDAAGKDAVKGLYEAEDVANMTFSMFIEHKLKG